MIIVRFQYISFQTFLSRWDESGAKSPYAVIFSCRWSFLEGIDPSWQPWQLKIRPSEHSGSHFNNERCSERSKTTGSAEIDLRRNWPLGVATEDYPGCAWLETFIQLGDCEGHGRSGVLQKEKGKTKKRGARNVVRFTIGLKITASMGRRTTWSRGSTKSCR